MTAVSEDGDGSFLGSGDREVREEGRESPFLTMALPSPFEGEPIFSLESAWS